VRVDIREFVLRKILRKKRHRPEELIALLENEVLDERSRKIWERLKKV
jgi:hypothetical protein